MSPKPENDRARIASAIADGFTNGNEQFEGATESQQFRYLMAADAVIAQRDSREPSPVNAGAVEGVGLRSAVTNAIMAKKDADAGATVWNAAVVECALEALKVFDATPPAPATPVAEAQGEAVCGWMRREDAIFEEDEVWHLFSEATGDFLTAQVQREPPMWVTLDGPEYLFDWPSHVMIALRPDEISPAMAEAQARVEALEAGINAAIRKLSDSDEHEHSRILDARDALIALRDAPLRQILTAALSPSTRED